jgi:hypothetical protein
MTPTPRPRRLVAAAAVLLGLALGGCAEASPGVVAYVGDDRITEGQLDEAVAGLTTALEEGQKVSSQAVVSALIQGQLAEQIAVEKQIPLTDAARDAVLKGSTLEPLAAVEGARPVVYDVADSQLVAQKLGDEAYLAEIARRHVTLNPRYGVLDPAQKTVVAGQSGSLSQPAEPS